MATSTTTAGNDHSIKIGVGRKSKLLLNSTKRVSVSISDGVASEDNVPTHPIK